MVHSTINDTLETYNDLSAIIDLQHSKSMAMAKYKGESLTKSACGTIYNLSSNIIHHLGPYYNRKTII